MSDPVTTPPTTPPTTEPQTAPPALQGDHMVPLSRLNEEIGKRKIMEDKIALLEASSKEQEVKRLKEAEDYRKLYEEAEKELATVKPRAAIAEEGEKTLRAVLDSQIAELPEPMRALIPSELTTQSQLRWLATNKALLLKPAPVDIGAGKQGGGAPAGEPLTSEEIEFAKQFGVKPEDYSKNKFK